jgi:hypothetical protein
VKAGAAMNPEPTRGWRVLARCLGGQVEYTRSAAKRRDQAELSLEMLIWTPAQHAAGALGDRMMCPR